MTTITITKEEMIKDINDQLCGLVELRTMSCSEPLSPNPIHIFTKYWEHPSMGDYVKTNEQNQCVLGMPREVFNFGYNCQGTSRCHPWLQEQENKYPGFIEKVWRNIKDI
jgi:hypothetical protein